MLLLTSQGELSTYGPGGRFGGLLMINLDLNQQIKKLNQIHTANPSALNMSLRKIQKSYSQWIETKQQTEKAQVRKY